jgi:hypothetical protein
VDPADACQQGVVPVLLVDAEGERTIVSERGGGALLGPDG